MIKDLKKRASHRAKIIEGQFRGLNKAIESEDYCVDVLTQSLAIQKSLKSLDKLILENHLKTHVKEGLKDGTDAEAEKIISEVLDIYELTNVRG